MVSKAQLFHCFADHESSYTRRKTDYSGARLMILAAGGLSEDKETRTYLCDICGEENDISLAQDAWMLIDATSGDIA